MKRVILILALGAATPALAQNQAPVQLPSEAACNVLRERVQIALVRADQALQAENADEVQRWSAIGAHYATIFASFCKDGEAE